LLLAAGEKGMRFSFFAQQPRHGSTSRQAGIRGQATDIIEIHATGNAKVENAA